MGRIRPEYLHAHAHDPLTSDDVRLREEPDEEEDEEEYEEEEDNGDEGDSEEEDEDDDQNGSYSVRACSH